MPYSRKRYGSRKYRKTSKSTPKGGARRKSRRGKYSKVSRKRSPWQAATTVSPYRRFVFNEDSITLSLTSVLSQQSYVFRGNSLYDPNYTGVGAQPYGFDQLCPTFYQNYNVKSSKITVYPSVSKVYETGFPPYFECLVVPYRATALPYSEMKDMRRMPGVRSIRFNADSQGNHATKISSYASSTSVLGREFAKDVSATGQYDGNPTYTWYWFVFIDTSSWPLTENVATKIDVKIVYYSKLLRKQELNES